MTIICLKHISKEKLWFENFKPTISIIQITSLFESTSSKLTSFSSESNICNPILFNLLFLWTNDLIK